MTSQGEIDQSPSKQSLRLWLKLLTKTNHLEAIVRAHLRSEFASTLPRFDVLAELSRYPSGLTMGELSSKLVVSNGNLTGLAKRLQDDGLLVRTPMPTDKRTHILYITRKGKSVFKEMAERHEEWVAEMFCDLSPDDVTTMISILSKIDKKK